MNTEYGQRLQKAKEICDTIGDLAEGLLIVGSVAYNPDAVTAKSDLDMVGVLDFSSANFKELYFRLGQTYEPIIAKYAASGQIHNVSIVWDTPAFEIGLHLWDTSAFERVVNLKEHNLIFRRKDFSRNFKSTADTETLRNLRGIEKQVYKEPKEVEGGTILKFFVYAQDASEFYHGIQISNLLMDPIVLCEQREIISKGLETFRTNMKNALVKLYGTSSESVNLYNALPQKLKDKLSNDLERRLKTFF